MSERLLRLRRLMARDLLLEHWKSVGEITGCADLVAEHEALGGHHWGGSKYDACVLQLLMSIMERCPEKLDELERFVDSVCADGSEFTHVTLARR